jgi:hypothetical protein
MAEKDTYSNALLNDVKCLGIAFPLSIVAIHGWNQIDAEDRLRYALPEPFDVINHVGSMVDSVTPSAMGILATLALCTIMPNLRTPKKDVIANGILSFVSALGYYIGGEYFFQEVTTDLPTEQRLHVGPLDILYGTVSTMALTGAIRNNTIRLAMRQHKTTDNKTE